jgi:chromosome segregation ATPase
MEEINDKERIILSLKIKLSTKETELDILMKENVTNNNDKERIHSLTRQLEKTEKELYETTSRWSIAKNNILGCEQRLADKDSTLTSLSNDISAFFCPNLIDAQEEIDRLKAELEQCERKMRIAMRRSRFV